MCTALLLQVVPLCIKGVPSKPAFPSPHMIIYHSKEPQAEEDCSKSSSSGSSNKERSDKTEREASCIIPHISVSAQNQQTWKIEGRTEGGGIKCNAHIGIDI